MEPYWQTKHTYWTDDFRFEIEQKWEIKKLLISLPGHKLLLETIRLLDCRMAVLKREYKSIYGDLPNLRRMKEKIEDKETS